ncbi:MAG: N-acetylmuramoyl-L-alanine amidase [Prevotella sp.]|nr:N-acetylmuramoyl-L-alanine amidase [Prevotella sp.]
MGKKIILLLLLFFALFATESVADGRFVLVIDAGHGGRDHGAPGLISKEKDLTLRYAMAFGKAVERHCPDVKVVYTRTTDRFIELWQRAEIANKNKADLFVSVHINALDGGKIARGFQTYTLGMGKGGSGILTNLQVAKRENSVILLEKNYKQTYQGFDPNSSESNIMFEFIQDMNMERSVELAKMMQRNVCSATGRNDMGAHQANLAVLRLTSMPGCLLELGFISTPDEEKFLNTSEGVERFTRGLLNAFVQYKNKYYGGKTRTITVDTEAERSRIVETTPTEQMQPEPRTQTTEVIRRPTEQVQTVEQSSTQTVRTEPGNIAPVFRVQIIASAKAIRAGHPLFRGLEHIEYYIENDMVKYTVGASTDYNEIYKLRKSLLERFPEAFIIAFKGQYKVDVNEAIREFKNNKNRR